MITPIGLFKTLFLTAVIGVQTTASLAADVKSPGFKAEDNCLNILAKATELDKQMIAAWAFGYLSAKQGDTRPVDPENNAGMYRNITRVCTGNPTLSLLEIVDGSKKPTADVPGSEAHARLFLEQFLAPGADVTALTKTIFPNEADIRLVYKDPLASNLVQYYGEIFTPGLQLAPKLGQNAVTTVHATTDMLINQQAVLRDFPGGYKKVLEYMNPGVPIVRFKFVKSGESLGLAFDGLVFVNGRWVLMPKPWRLLDQ